MKQAIQVGLLSGISAIALSETAATQERLSKPITERSKTILPHRIWRGPQASKQLVVFVHGWPDDLNLFEALATRLAKDYHCCSTNLPGYPLPPNFNGHRGTVPERKWGFTIEETIFALKSTVDYCCTELGGCSNVTLITHDWGAIYGYLLDDRYPALVQRMVSIDVGWRVNGPKPAGLLFTLAYQGFLNACFLMPESIGSALTASLSGMLGRVPAPNAGPVSGKMNWCYRAAWRDLATKGPLTKMDRYEVTKKPRLFIYSHQTSPATRFSDEAWYDKIDKSYPGISRAVGVEGNHWMINSHPNMIGSLIENWLKTSQHVMISKL